MHLHCATSVVLLYQAISLCVRHRVLFHAGALPGEMCAGAGLAGGEAPAGRCIAPNCCQGQPGLSRAELSENKLLTYQC